MSKPSPFEAAAARLDKLVAEVKDAQFAATGAAARPVPPPAPDGAPDAFWSRSFGARVVRPHAEGAPPMPGLAPVERPEPPPVSIPEPTAIGTALGKPGRVRRRPGWLFGRGKR